ncbi:regulatory protein YycH of two-component signal transduction system YycFG [Paenibacillus sp. DS2015]|uniref:YycH family regulatory protein n=1 Tax=Paenibacillus sp. DS2015 TaxID=3373917 RepID=UPI003D1F8E73
MKEKLKTVLLVLLVTSSLVQSYFLMYRLPGSDSVAKTATNYIKTDDMGPEERAENLIYPDKMVIHMGGDKHTIFYPHSTFYDLIFSRLQARSFDSFQRRSIQNIDISELRAQNDGIELTFASGVPVTLLERVMQIQPDALFQAEQIDRIWIYNVKNETKAHALFFSTEGDVVYEAGKADLTAQDVQQHVDFGKEWTAYTSIKGSYYIPESDIDMVEAEFEIGVYDTEQMQRSLFVDPSITRNIREKDGSEIYTDSKRSLQVRQEQKWMSYTDPAALPAGESSAGSDVLAAIDFVNQHGGWNGDYRLSVVGDGEPENKVVFQQYYGAYPVLDTPQFQYGVMTLNLQQGTVSSYQRSLIYSESGVASKKVKKLQGGDKLRARLKDVEKISVIVDVYPAYQPSLTKNGIRLTPVWAVRLQNGTVTVLK